MDNKRSSQLYNGDQDMFLLTSQEEAVLSKLFKKLKSLTNKNVELYLVPNGTIELLDKTTLSLLIWWPRVTKKIKF